MVEPTIEIALDLLNNVRQADVDEFYASSKSSPEEVLADGIQRSTMLWAGLVDGRCMCIFGVVPFSLLGSHGAPWLIGTDLIDQHARAFARRNRCYIRTMLSLYSHLENFVDARNLKAVRWLRWMGFTIHEAKPYGALQLPFHRFEMRADHV